MAELQTGIVKYDITDAAIAEMKDLYMGLIIVDLKDKEQFDAVHSARMVVKGKRIDVEKTRKGLKADALAWGKKVDAEAKRIFAKLEPIETHLEKEEKKVTDEQKRIKAEEEEKERLIIQGRVDALLEYGVALPFFEVAAMTEEEANAKILEVKAGFEAEKKRLAEEEAARKAEAERLEKIRLEQEAEAERLAEAQRKIDKANAKIEAEKKALEDAKKEELERKTKLRSNLLYLIGLNFDGEQYRYKDINVHWTEITTMTDVEFDALVEKIKPIVEQRKAEEKKRVEDEAKLAAEKAAKEKAEREAREKVEAEQKAKEEVERQEALKPDREKLISWAESIASLVVPDVKDEFAQGIVINAENALATIAQNIIKQAKEL